MEFSAGDPSCVHSVFVPAVLGYFVGDLKVETAMSQTHSLPLTRRRFLEKTLVCSGGLWAARQAPAASKAPSAAGRRPKVAAIFTELRFRSHAYNILENFFEPYLFNGELVDPGVDVVSFYADQFPDGEMARDVSKRFGVPLYDSISDALCLGGRELSVDAVLSIGEHGDYPRNEQGVVMYPRKRFFDESYAVMKRSGRFVPFFNDKHLSYRWDWAKEMYDLARESGMPLMAGSSVPLAERRPPLELPENAELEEAVSIHGGGIESYDFHALEVLESIVEVRRGGETGIERVELLTGEAFERASNSGRWSQDLVDAAMQAEQQAGTERQSWPIKRREKKPAPTTKTTSDSDRSSNGSHAIVLTYRDGFRATVLKVDSSSNRWNFACRARGTREPLATSFYNGPWGNRCLFKALSHAIQYHFVHQREPYPVERTLLVSGVLASAMKSHAQDGTPINTPHLDFAYKPIDFRAQREMGKTWKTITLGTKQPIEFAPGDRKFLNADGSPGTRRIKRLR